MRQAVTGMLAYKRKWLRANLPPSLAPQGFPLLGWHHLIDATSASREALWNRAQRHLHPFPFPFLGLVAFRLDLWRRLSSEGWIDRDGKRKASAEESECRGKAALAMA
jgi:hypothetical protein